MARERCMPAVAITQDSMYFGIMINTVAQNQAAEKTIAQIDLTTSAQVGIGLAIGHHGLGAKTTKLAL